MRRKKPSNNELFKRKTYMVDEVVEDELREIYSKEGKNMSVAMRALQKSELERKRYESKV